ncbi:polysaccharide biosynthesis C-terminal domain-containing protein [Sphingobacterium faecium]|uniref:lipopolysaccharide biosynthesis protein n=1 Tax=Sphingobacterium faecium TaxID=34087 RepID=UPI0021B6130F|nr:polysaccharide biosynthesis C-terminal domain-containing protein [Sphingobacterium faecium]UXD69322.1 polysaccharide biosynthesis C-terminal domain-containing protein [Sphingobacterium faecium]
MSSIIKESLKTSGVNYIGIVLGAIFTLYLTPKYLPTEFNGLYRLLLEYSAIAAVYFHFGMPAIINKYYHKVHYEGANSKGFDFFVFIFPLLVIAIFVFLLYFFKSQFVTLISSEKDSEIIANYIVFIVPLILCNVYFFIFEAYSAMLGNITVINFFKNIVLKIFNILSVFVYFFSRDFSLVMMLITAGYLISIICVYIYVLKLKKFEIDLRPSLSFLKENKLVKDFVQFVMFLSLSNLSFFLLSKIDIFFVGKFTDLSNLAYYTTATYFVTLLLVPYSAVLNISFPKIAKTYVTGNMDELKSLITNNAMYGLVLAVYIFIIIWSNLDAIYTFIPNGELYKAGKYIFLILSIGKLIDISIGSLGQLITISKWYMLTLYSSIAISIISVLLGYYLTSTFGILGASTSLSLCLLLSVLVQLYIAKRKIGVFPYSKKIVVIIFIIPLIIGGCMLVDQFVSNIMISSLLKISAATILYFYIVCKFRVSDDIIYIIDRGYRMLLKNK